MSNIYIMFIIIILYIYVLFQIGLKGGLRELFKYYDNDVFGRRKAVTEKCKELQKIIDQFVEGVKNPLHNTPVEETSPKKLLPRTVL